MFRFVWLTIVLSLFTISSANALVFVEPFGGYATGKISIKATDLGSSMSVKEDLDMSGLTYGIRGGLELGGLQLGLDYSQNTFSVDKGDNIELDDDVKSKEMAAFLGYRFWFARIYGGYIFNADIDSDFDFDPGTGFKVGATFYAFEHLAISLEYRTVDIDAKSDSGIKIDPEYNTTAILLSFPFGI